LTPTTYQLNIVEGNAMWWMLVLVLESGPTAVKIYATETECRTAITGEGRCEPVAVIQEKDLPTLACENN
jgi:hypothetical protein